MITAVIITNCLLALICLGLAWRLWQLRHSLRQLRWMLGDVTHNVEASLQGATEAIVSGQQSTQRLQWRYRHMGEQLEQLRRLLIVASWGQSLLLKRMGRQRRLRVESLRDNALAQKAQTPGPV